MERVLVPERLPGLLRAVHAALVEHRDEIDALNVFPVPDGDTGTNLAGTSAAVVAAVDRGAVDGADLVRAALRSARGNSGVIFSQVLRAVIEALHDASPDATDVRVLAAALADADRLARDAVAEPVEGTILTALAVAARTAEEAEAAGEEDVVAVLTTVLSDVSDAVLATREQLDVLREAGVVDAGARGLEVVVAAISQELSGAPGELANLGPVVPRCLDIAAGGDVDVNPIEVQFVLDGDAGVAADLRAALMQIGGSVVVVEADGLVSAHVHTPDPDAAIAAGARVGQPDDVRVTDLRDELPGTVELAVVAVLPRAGLADLGRASGAAVVEGAAGDLPSVAELVRAVRSCPGGHVLVLPGHPNVVPTARQAAEVIADEGGPVIEVLAGADHPLVVLSCLALATDDLGACKSVVDGCRSGEVVAAVRDASTPAGPVAEGQPLVVVDETVVAVTDDVSQALVILLGELGADRGELVTVAIGADAGVDEETVLSMVEEHSGQAEVEVLDGGQRPSLFIAAVES